MKLSKKLALSTCLVSFVGLTGTAMANGMPAAANCCGQVAELEKRVKRLEDKAVESTSRKLFVSGHLNRAVMWVDNGRDANTQHVDNYAFTSRITVGGEAAYNEDISFGMQLTLNPRTHSTVNQTGPHNTLTASGAESTLIIHTSEVYMSSKKFGTLTAGHGSFASYGAYYTTMLSGAFNASEPYVMNAFSPFRAKVTGAALGTLPLQIFQPPSNPNLVTRADRIMYWTPSWNGFSMGASHGYHARGDLLDVAAKFAGKFGGWILAADAAFMRNHSRDAADTALTGANGVGVTFDQYHATAAVLAPFSITGKDGTGVFARFAWGKRDYDVVRHKDGRVMRGNLGYKDMFTDMGMTIFEGSYGTYRNMALRPTANQTVVGKAWNLGVQQNIDSVGTELYANYTNMKVKIKNQATRYNDQDVVLVGARVKF